MALKVKGIVCHLSASKWGDAAEVKKWHKARGFRTIGYHGVILNGCRGSNLNYDVAVDGKIEPGRPEAQEGAHCLAAGMNECTIGVCCIGTPGFPPEDVEVAPKDIVRGDRAYMTRRQFDSLMHWLSVNCKQYNLNPLGTFKHPRTGKSHPVITQHSDHDPGKPLCASLNLAALRREIKKRIDAGTW